MEENDLFFKRIIEMISPELYNPLQSEEFMNQKYFKHRLAPLTTSEKKVLREKRHSLKYDTIGKEAVNKDQPDSASKMKVSIP
jgi:hypothetical protein